MNKNHYVYLITNLINSKMYIGKRSCDCKIQDDSYMGSGKHLYYAKKKYGIENFSKLIIEVCDTEEKAYEREKYWIEKYNALDNKRFYNLTVGGEGNSNHDRFNIYDNDIVKLNKNTMYISNKFMRNNKLSLQEKCLYMYISSFENTFDVRQKLICEDLNITPTTLRKLIKSLEDKKYIYVQRRYDIGSKEKKTPIVFPIPLSETTGDLTDNYKDIINYSKSTYPSDY